MGDVTTIYIKMEWNKWKDAALAIFILAVICFGSASYLLYLVWSDPIPGLEWLRGIITSVCVILFGFGIFLLIMTRIFCRKDIEIQVERALAKNREEEATLSVV
jgi:vacuolar-type H+-ATPase subunit I/STV1